MDKETQKLLNKLKNNNISLDLWADFEEIRASMQIDGSVMSDDDLIAAINLYRQEGDNDIFETLKERSEREGVSYNDLVDEYLKKITASQ